MIRFAKDEDHPQLVGLVILIRRPAISNVRIFSASFPNPCLNAFVP